jgi:DNA-binding CsgD family transcriptional regulator
MTIVTPHAARRRGTDQEGVTTAELSSFIASDAADLSDAAAACDFPLWIWQLPDGVIRIVNPAGEALVGLPREQLIGRPITEFLLPSSFVDAAISAYASGAVNATLTRRELTARAGGPLVVWVWTRGLELTTGPRNAVSLVMPEPELGRLGTDPGRPWRHLAEVVVGAADPSWRIERISSDAFHVLGARPKDLIGTSLRDLVHPDDVDGIGLLDGNDPRLPMRGRLRRPDGGWTEVGLLFAAVVVEGEPHICFAFIAHPVAEEHPDRVAELEHRLRRIAQEIRAAQVLDTVQVLPSAPELPLGELSSRQWEILSRLMRGQRVGSIAQDLYVSPSTVRNHLSHIFRRFGVHSQRELLDLLRSR